MRFSDMSTVNFIPINEPIDRKIPYQMKIFKGCAPWILSDQPPNHYHCCVTSPPYWGLRDYGGEPSDWPAVSYAPMAGLQPVEVAAQRCCLGQHPQEA